MYRPFWGGIIRLEIQNCKEKNKFLDYKQVEKLEGNFRRQQKEKFGETRKGKKGKIAQRLLTETVFTPKGKFLQGIQ